VDAAAAAPASGSASVKREAIERAARAVFGRLGYARAPIDQIAAEAGVSTRTLYNHFGDKLGLFSHVLVHGATEVADAFEQRLEGDPSEPARALMTLAEAIVAHRAQFPEHFALVSRLNAERDQFPDALVAAWLAAGPQRVRTLLESRLELIASASGIALVDPRAAARHLVALTESTLLTEPESPRSPTHAELSDAVAVFARGYGFAARPVVPMPGARPGRRRAAASSPSSR
jgi:AcrR family transcriptional regulator